MKSTSVMQFVRLVGMILAVVGIIYAIEYLRHGIAVWFWVALLGIGFVGLLVSFRIVRRRNQPKSAPATTVTKSSGAK